MDGEFHINHWYGENAYLVQRVCKIEAKNTLFSGYLAKAVYSPIKYYEAILLGATVAHLGAKHLNSINLLWPSPKLHQHIDLFNQIETQIIQLASANNNLKKTRDLLLSRLISGKLPVDDLDIQFPPSMMPTKEPPHA